MPLPWEICACGHPMLMHDVEDMDGTNPRCCVDGCDQRGCREEPGKELLPLTTGTTGHLACGYCVTDGMTFCPLHGWRRPQAPDDPTRLRLLGPGSRTHSPTHSPQPKTNSATHSRTRGRRTPPSTSPPSPSIDSRRPA
jgi:hypothetical protein